MRLYEASRDRRYLAWCEWSVNNIDRWSASDTFSNLDRVAAGRMNLGKIQPNVHSHTLHMNLIGFLRLYQATGDRHYLTKVQGAWRNIMENYRYITGGVSVGEGYREPHALPNTGNVVETCASMSWILLNQYLLELTADPMYADTIERLLWSHLFAAQTSDGDGFRYFSPLNGWKPAGYYTGPDCCSASGTRIVAMLPSLVYASSRDAVYVNQYVDSSVRVKLEDATVTLRQRTKYPEDGNIVVEVRTQEPAGFAVNLRLPSWCLSPSAKVNGEPLNDLRRGGYATVRRTWKTGDRIELSLPMEARWVEGSYANTGLVALERGPMVYALDAIWQNEPTARALAGDRKGDDVPGLRGVGPELREAAVPEGALGPAYEVNAVLTGGESTKALLLPFANLGKWYRTAEEKAAGLRETQGSGNPRGQPIKSQRTAYAVWLRAAGKATL
jgi:hypothetical protein